MRYPSIDDLWKSAQPRGRCFDAAQLGDMPDAAQRYLRHSIAAGTPLASAVRLKMHGSIRLKAWLPFDAEEVICWERGMMWRAAVRMHGIPIRGGDSWLEGQGAMRWRLPGIFPVVNASGPDITRSAAGRMNIESIWLPSVLLARGVANNETAWTASDDSHLHAGFSAHGETAEIDYVIGENGGLRSVSMPRWGNPEGAEFRLVDCGGFVEREGTLGGYTIPAVMRVGWHFGSERFDSEGEFFRVTIDEAVYR
jgi:hypothetical protein